MSRMPACLLVYDEGAMTLGLRWRTLVVSPEKLLKVVFTVSLKLDWTATSKSDELRGIS